MCRIKLFSLLLLFCFLNTTAVSAKLSGSDLKKHQMFMSQFPIVKDKKLNDYVTEIGNRILAVSPHADRDYQFIIRDNPTPNAFVAGYDVVYVERGLLTLLNSEAELAAVMGHEIGHNVGRHVKRRSNRMFRNQVLAFISSVLVGNSGVGNALMTQATVNEFEYTREAELEADRFAAEYLYRAGYEPSQLVPALSQLKDFGSLMSQLEGVEIPHQGLVSTHPRNDKRLRQVVAAAGELPPGEGYIGRDEYREAISGIVYGPNYANVAPEGFERYSNERLGITFLYPDSWNFKLSGSKIVLKDSNDTAQLKIEIEKSAQKATTSMKAIKAKYPDIVNAEPIHKESQRDLGTLGALPGQRLALSMVGRNTYHFQGLARDNNITAEQDKVFVGVIRSFRRMTREDRTGEEVTKLFFERLKPGQTFASLVKEEGIDAQLAETELRVINGYYPNGEPEPGTWIKKMKKVKVGKKTGRLEPSIEDLYKDQPKQELPEQDSAE